VRASAANVLLTALSPVEDASDEIAATLLNLERQLCRVFLFRLDISYPLSGKNGYASLHRLNGFTVAGIGDPGWAGIDYNGS
jgi:hypothetical protein